MINQRFRKDYVGEFVVLRTTFRSGTKIQEQEWINNPIINAHTSERAAVILGDRFINKFNHKKLEKHKGGLKGSKRLQTYGTGDAYKSLKLDFCVTTDIDHLDGIVQTSYDEHTVVYSDQKRVMSYQNKLFLIPYCVRLCDPALALYLACFDQHQEIYVLGADKDLPCRQPGWDRQLAEVMRCYDNCQFYFVGTESMMSDFWRRCANFHTMDYRKFVSHCDI